jgi:tRNA (guanine-N7-)-methyltransferase
MASYPAASRRTLYGRRRGRKLRPGRERIVARLLPRLAIKLPTDGRLDPQILFDCPVSDLWIEVGFGAGEHLVAQAQAHPGIGMMGCEPYLQGVATLLSVVTECHLGNIRILVDDARPLLDALPDASIGRLFALFPDPWPKARHHKRRFINPETLDACGRVMRDGAELRIATDLAEHCRWILYHVRRHDAFAWLAQSPCDWRVRPEDWPQTRYELKAMRQGRQPVYLRFRRIDR